MADFVFNPVAGIPFSGGQRMVDLGDTTFAPVGTAVGPSPLLSLSVVSATGPGAVLDNHGTRNNHSLVVTTSAGVTAGVVQLQGSQDNTNWVNLLTPTGSSPSVQINTTAANTTYLGIAQLSPFRYLRANVTTAITGGTIIAYVASTA